MGRRRRTRGSGWTPGLLALAIALVMIPVNWIVEQLGLWDWRDGYGQHTWGTFVFAVLVPSVVLVLIGYDALSRRRRRHD